MFKPKFACVVPFDFIGCFMVKLVAVPHHIHFVFVLTEFFLLVNLDCNDSVCCQYNMGLRVSGKAEFKPVSSATETSKTTEILLVASLNMILSKTRITRVLIRLRGCKGWSAPVFCANPRRQVFLR